MDKAKKEQYIIKTLCIIAAFVLWLFITSTENPLTTYKIKSIPVQLLNTDELTSSNLVLVPDQNLTIELSIKAANTSTLLSTKADDFTITADLSKYALKSGEQNIPIVISKSPDNINVVNGDILFVKVNLDVLVENKLPITVNVSGQPSDGYYASQPILSQTSASVVGGEKFVHKVKSVVVEQDIKGVKDDVAKTYKLKPMDESGEEVKNVIVNPAQINVKVSVRKTKYVGVTVKTVGTLNSSFTLGSTKASPKQFSVTGSVEALDKVANLDTQDIDLSKIDKSTTISTKVIIPDGLTLVSGTDNVNVEVNLDKVVAEKPVAEVTADAPVQKSISQGVTYINLNKLYEAKLSTDKDLLVVSGTQAIIDSLDLTKIVAELDLSNLVEGEHDVEVKVSMPDGLTLVSQNSSKVLVTITKKTTEVPKTNGNKSK
ncbi:MAG: CdaR family protein [Clostridium sp.]|uniref:CdaR family protein n=1 Tax=Clostridium sp. TaxID=1506 RepID=UPI003D6CDEC9